ncbi:HPr family phosphocarrier protein [Lysobacter pythonis]|uniref:HPr family phosphocarrier protein n=1 Tax=Solilutibacter pythonis TaxID=2483112 RepID=A0A3M2I772_9GAMM|nr:HPr family phosphocarrier protein [Lysobacter pythonis]RMH94124.1 HPr family phosphocarrier protein [Lysobacter pythonis]
MIEREIIVTNQLGLHARASAKLVQTVSGFRSGIRIAAKGREVDAKSIMGVMMLAAGQGTVVRLRIDGEDEATAMDAVTDLFARNFDEGG